MERKLWWWMEGNGQQNARESWMESPPSSSLIFASCHIPQTLTALPVFVSLLLFSLISSVVTAPFVVRKTVEAN